VLQNTGMIYTNIQSIHCCGCKLISEKLLDDEVNIYI